MVETALAAGAGIVAVLAAFSLEGRRAQAILRRADALRERGDGEAANALLARLSRGPWLPGSVAPAWLQGQLAGNYWLDQRWAEAEACCRQALSRRLPPWFQATLRLRLADCLESQGRSQDARAEREKVDRLLDSLPPNPLTFVAIAKKLEAEERLDEACDAYRRAVESSKAGPLRPLHLLASAHCHWNALQPESALRDAEEALTLNLAPGLRAVAESLIGLSLKSLYRYDEARLHFERALEIARERADRVHQAQYLAMRADIDLHAGHLSEALRCADEALAVAPEASWFGRGARAETLYRLGRFDEALAEIAQARERSGPGTAAMQRRLQGALATVEATILAEADRLDEACRALEAAGRGMEGTRMTRLWLRGDRAWILAKAGRHAESAEEERLATALLTQIPDQSLAFLGALERIGIARFYRGELAACEKTLERFLKARPTPIQRSRALYYLGGCRRARGGTAAARAAYDEAVAAAAESLYAARAREASRTV